MHSATDFVSFVTKIRCRILHSSKLLFLNEILFNRDFGKIGKRLTKGALRETLPSFPTKLSTGFVDKEKYPRPAKDFSIVSQPSPHKDSASH